MIHGELQEFAVSNTNQPISKTFQRLFKIIHVMFLFDFGFIRYKSTRHRFITKFCIGASSTIAGVTLILIIGYKMEQRYSFWYTVTIFVNCIYIIMLLIIPERSTFYNFLKKLLWIDSQVMTKSSSYYLELKLLLVCIAAVVYRIMMVIINCKFFEFCVTNIFTQMIFSVPSITMDIPIMVFYFVFHGTYMRLVALRKFINVKNFEPKKALLLYKYLIDSVENIKNAFDPIFIFTLCVNIPIAMVIIYEAIKHTKVELIMTCAAFLTRIFAPAIAASSLSTEVDKMNIILHDMLFVEKDQNKKEDIMKFINYIEARPFKFRVFKIIPLDATFPVAVINICITYLVVALQLNHIY